MLSFFAGERLKNLETKLDKFLVFSVLSGSVIVLLVDSPSTIYV